MQMRRLLRQVAGMCSMVSMPIAAIVLGLNVNALAVIRSLGIASVQTAALYQSGDRKERVGKWSRYLIAAKLIDENATDTEIVYANFEDQQGNQMSFDIDSTGVISNFYSDDRFCLEHPPSVITPSLWQYNSATNILE